MSNTAKAQPSVSTLLVRLVVESKAELFHDDEGNAYATVTVKDHRETHELGSAGFRYWLGNSYYLKHHGAPNSQGLKDAIDALSAEAKFKGATRRVFLRVGEAEGNIFIDRGAPDWEILAIRPDNWEPILYKDCPVRFRRSSKTGVLPRPVSGGSIDQLRSFINIAESDWILVLAYMVAALRPDGQYPVLSIVGGQGDGKSTTARILKRLIDPSAIELRTPPKNLRDLAAAVRNCWFSAFDNVSHLSGDLSDALCRLSTGGSFGGRELYKDFDEAAFSAERPVILTSITQVVGRPDLLDRTLTITMRPIENKSRESEARFMERFSAQESQMLLCLYSAVASALRDVDSIKLPTTPRMADFAVWAAAALPALDVDGKQFLKAYESNRHLANEIALDASPIAPLIMKIACPTWRGTATTLVERLDEEAAPQLQRFLPHSGRAMRAALDRVIPNLKAIGIEVEFGRGGHGGDRIITIGRADTNYDRQQERHPDRQQETRVNSAVNNSADGADGRIPSHE